MPCKTRVKWPFSVFFTSEGMLSPKKSPKRFFGKGVSAGSGGTEIRKLLRILGSAVHSALRAPQSREAYMFAKAPFYPGISTVCGVTFCGCVLGATLQERKISPKRKLWGWISRGHPGSFARTSRPKTSVRALKILEKQAFGRGHP